MKERETRLRRKEDSEVLKNLEMFRSLYENSPLGYQSLDEQGNFIIVNQTWLDLFGYSNKEEVVGKNFGDFITERELFAERFPQFKACGITNEVLFEMIKKDGSLILVSIDGRVSCDKDGNFIQTHCLLHDITEHKKAEKEIKLFSRIFEDSLNEIYLFTEDTLKFRQVNSAAQQNLGYSMKEFLNLTPLDLKPQFTHEAFAELVDPLRKGEKKKIVFETVHKRKDQSLYNVEVHLQLLEYENEALFTAIILDITNRKKAEQELRSISSIPSENPNPVVRIDNTYKIIYRNAAEGWARALDYRDKETEGHSRRVTNMTVRIASEMGIDSSELAHVRRGALLHDIGKLGVPDSILFKPEELTEIEWELMKHHPVIAYEILSPIPFLRQSLDIPYCHHEKIDGSGYPQGLKGELIPIAARIFAIVDVWDALISDRPYRAAWSKEDAREHIRSLSGTHFDPEVVKVFLKIDF